ncbi:MalY/PatB family protein [Chachezhania antarctica]|uniref:MalY/PatB family protein n=1 Tax=Chachezhania antarctica TaxID=2340860 RepID=UPI000EB1262B|nr:MalY/PatB family protein [Chachezhania antarctica]|tara:strand:- start:3826 stop:5001 length:1176 start_codon:yes stop_codon:yes gene_type:complete
MTHDFDELFDRRGTYSSKWDRMETFCGVSPDDGLPMWVADTDFRPPKVVRDRLEEMAREGQFGYSCIDDDYKAAICWWMEHRHGWTVDPEWIFTTTGIVNAVGLCMDAFTKPGDGIVTFNPVYHAFAKVIGNAKRRVVECPLVNDNGRYTMDFDAYDAILDGSETMLILCSPHNPGGRVWTREELESVVAFAKKHDLLIVSDEIHHDLVFPGQKHVPMALIEEAQDRLVMLSAPSKTFNLAGLHTGNTIIPDPALRERFAERMGAIYIAGNSAGQMAAMTAYSPEGAAWVDAQMAYLDTNRKIFDAGVNAIPGVASMALEGTYLAWVDFTGTGMTQEEVLARVQEDAKIAVNQGPAFGLGGEKFLRFNLGTQKARVEEAVTRLQRAFADLQ